MSDDEQMSLFGSPPTSPRPMLALPRARTSIVNIAESATNMENVGATAHIGLHPFFDNVTSPVTVASPLRPPALSKDPPRSSSVPTALNSLSRRNEHQSSSQNPSGPHGQATSGRSTPARVLAQPLDLPETVEAHGKGLLRSHPSLLGKAGAFARVRPNSVPPLSSSFGSTATNPILVDDDQSNLYNPSTSRPLFQPRFAPTEQRAPPNRLPSQQPSLVQNCVSSRDILSSAIVDRCINNPSVCPSVIQSLKQSSRFKNLLKDLIAFVRAVETYSRRRSDARFATGRSPKRRRPNMPTKVPSGAENWDVPYPFQEGEAPPRYFEDWQSKHARRLMEEFVVLLQHAQKGTLTEKENLVEKFKTKTGEAPSFTSAKRKRKAAAAEMRQDTSPSKPPGLGLDQLWKILRDFNSPEGGSTSAGAPSLTTGPSEFSFPSCETPQSSAGPLYQSLGDQAGQPVGIATEHGAGAEHDAFSGMFEDQSSTATKELGMGTKFTTPSIVDFSDPGVTAAVGTNGLSDPHESSLPASLLQNFDYDELASFIDSMTQQPPQLSSGDDVGDFDAFFTSTLNSDPNAPSHFDHSLASLDWNMPIGSSMAGLGVDSNTLDPSPIQTHNYDDQFLLDWQQPAPSFTVPGDGDFSQSIFDPLLTDPAVMHQDRNFSVQMSQINGIVTSFGEGFSTQDGSASLDDGVAEVQTTPIHSAGRQPTAVPSEPSTLAHASMMGKATPPINPFIIRKQNALSKAAVRRQQILEEMEQVKKSLWELTVEASVLNHIVIPPSSSR